MAAATLEKAAQREISWKWRLMMVTGWTGGQPAPCMYLFAVMYYVCLLSVGKIFFHWYKLLQGWLCEEAARRHDRRRPDAVVLESLGGSWSLGEKGRVFLLVSGW